MSKVFGREKLAFKCGKCGHKLSETIARLETSPKLRCPKCGVDIQVDATQLRAGLLKVDKAIEKLTNSVMKVGKRR